MSYTVYKLDNTARQQLLAHFVPKFPDVIAHHVTIEFGVPATTQLQSPGRQQQISIVGYVEGDGIEAAIVQVGGTTRRPDGKTFHITLSLDRSKGRKPVDSNALIIEKGWNKVQPFSILTTFELLH